MAVVAIAREIGAGAAEVAAAVAHGLGAELVDRRIIDEVARRLRIAPEEAERFDEHRESLLERLLFAIGSGSTYGVGDAWSWTPPYPGDPAFDVHRASRRVTEDVIREAVRGGSVVIVGRGAAHLLRDDPSVLRVFLRASVETRRTRLMNSQRIDAKTAADRVRESDVNWGAYVRDAYHVDWRDPASYDLVIDTGRLGARRAARLILAALPPGGPGEDPAAA
ncbi:MAG: cytidylate kinase-like family protein [Chloroflexota bacterium]|nr:cytidylate kinase family protein [Chloroflexota bacterium]MDE3103286.1 cytidylate kinase-like family protein [Chloroflexota bacterium]